MLGFVAAFLPVFPALRVSIVYQKARQYCHFPGLYHSARSHREKLTMEVEVRGIESQIVKLKDSLKESLIQHTSPEGKVSLMKIFCDDELESHAAIFVCQELIEEFISAACLPLIITKSQSEIRPIDLAILMQAFINTCDEISRSSANNPTTQELYQYHINLAKRHLDGKSGEDIAKLIDDRLTAIR